MKTALQEAIKDLKEDKQNSNYAMEKSAIQDCIIILSSYLEKEKQQIVDAYNDGQEHGFNKFGSDAEKYYEETFK